MSPTVSIIHDTYVTLLKSHNADQANARPPDSNKKPLPQAICPPRKLRRRFANKSIAQLLDGTLAAFAGRLGGRR